MAEHNRSDCYFNKNKPSIATLTAIYHYAIVPTFNITAIHFYPHLPVSSSPFVIPNHASWLVAHVRVQLTHGVECPVGPKFRYLGVGGFVDLINSCWFVDHKNIGMAESVNPEEVTRFINNYIKPNDFKAWTAIGVSVLIEVLAYLLIQYDLGLVGWAVHTLNMVRLFIQFHDMAHFSFFSSIAMNKLVGKAIGIYVHFPFNSWRDGHNHHHKHFGNLDRTDLSQTILFTKKQYQEMKMPLKLLVRIFREPVIFFTFTVQFVWFFGILYNCVKRYGVFSSSVLQKLLSVVLFTWGLDLVGLPFWPMYWSVHIAQAIGTMLFHLQHSVNEPYRERQQKWNFAKAALEGSTFLYIPPLLRPFSNGIEYHHIHHLNTNVASYVIQTCHEEFEQLDKSGLHWDHYNINRVDLGLACRSLLNVMLDEENATLVPFSYTSL